MISRLLALALLLPALALAAPDAGERRIAAAVDRHVPEGLALLESTVNLNSGTLNFDGVRAVADRFAPAFEDLGFSVRWVDGTPWGRAGHLVAERDGEDDAPHVLLIGHLDTVFEPDSPFQEYRALGDTAAVGPGTTDMKGGIVVMLLALRALEESEAGGRLGFTVVLTGDEENPGSPLELARHELVTAADRADYALGFEDGDGDPRTAVVARRGFESWTLTTTGRPSHSSQVFREGVGSGAVFEMARILAAFHEELGGEPYLTFNPGVALGGTEIEYDREANRGTAFGKRNVVAAQTVVDGDLRTLTREQAERARETMRRIAGENLPGTGATLTFHEGYPPLAPTEGNRRLLALLDGASRDLGLGPVEAVDPARAGAADVSFTAGRVEGALDGLGLMGTGGHTEDETADLRTLAGQAKRAALLLHRLATAPR